MGFFKKLLERSYKSLEIKNHELLYVFLEITRKCNLNCLHCGSDCKNEVLKEELSFDGWKTVIDTIAENFSPQLSFVITGGEPLLSKDLVRIGGYIASKNRRWGMVTNGMILTKKVLDELICAGLSSLTLSVDGLSDHHNWLRNSPKAFDCLQVAMDAIGKSKLKHKDAVTCVNPRNLGELDSIGELLIEKGFNSWRLFRIFPSGRAFQNSDLLLSFDDTMKMINWIKENRRRYNERGLLLNFACEGYLPIEESLVVRGEPFLCRAGVNIAGILADGTVTGCTNNAPFFYEGNIKSDEFVSLWENGFQKFRNREWAKTGVCGSCSEFKSCSGSSIHLWQNPEDGIAFCYLKEMK